MDMLTKLRAKAETILADQKAISAAAEAANRDMTADEVKAYDAKTAAFDGAMAEIDRVKAADARDAALARTQTAPIVDVTGAVKSVTHTPAPAFSNNVPDLTTVQKLGLCGWAAGAGRKFGIDPCAALEANGFKAIADGCRETRAAVQTNATQKALTSLSGGGVDNMIYTPLMNDFIEVLRASSAFIAAGPIQIDMPLGGLEISGGNTGATASYGAQGQNAAYSQMTTRKIDLKAKHLKVLTAVNNYALETSPLAVAAIVGNDLLNAMAIALDAAGLRGDGTGDNPMGIRSIAAPGSVFAVPAGLTPTLVQVDAVIKRMLNHLATSNIPLRRVTWIMSNRVVHFLRFLRDGNGNKAYPGMSEKAVSLEGYPVISSEQVPSSLGVSTIDSEIYLADFNQVIMGVTRGIRIDASQEAAYVDGASNTRAAFSLDETVLRAMAAHDFEMRYALAASIATGVQWT